MEGLRFRGNPMYAIMHQVLFVDLRLICHVCLSSERIKMEVEKVYEMNKEEYIFGFFKGLNGGRGWGWLGLAG